MILSQNSSDITRPTGDQTVASVQAVDRSSTRVDRRYGSSGKLPSSEEPVESVLVRISIEQFCKLYRTLPEEIVKKVYDASNALIELYHLFGFNRIETAPHSEWVDYHKMLHKFRMRMSDFLVKTGDPNGWVAYLKFKTCAFYSFYEGQDRPDPPKGLEKEKDGVIFGGRANRWVRLLKKNDKELFDSFITSVNLAKKGLPRPTADMREAACIKTLRALTTEPYIPEVANITMDWYNFPEAYTAENPNGSLTKDLLKSELRRTVEELFEDRPYKTSLHYKPFFPSTSANYIRSRGKAGAVSVIIDVINQLRKVVKISDNLVKLNLIDIKARGKLSQHYGQVGVKEDLRFFEEMKNGQLYNEQAVGYDDSELNEVWVQLFNLIELLAYTEEPLVETVALLEALKIRVISKGPPLLYTLLKPMQKHMWNVLSENKIFKMISEPITEKHINDMFGKISPEEIMVNGDYKASTDNLHGYCSEEVVNCLIDVLNKQEDDERHHLNEKYREMFIRSLTKHKFINQEYDEIADQLYQERHNDLAPDFCEEVKYEDRRELQRILPQREGQLMGSVTSFPILCIVNATLCRMALENTNGIKYRIRDRSLKSGRVYLPLAPLYINGDDCTLKGSRTRNGGLRVNWERITAFGGLSSSVGKTFFSKEDRPICVLNSMTYLYDHEKEIWKVVRAVNLGILFGLQRSSTELGQRHEYHQLGSLHRDLRKECPEKIWSQVSSRFIHYQIDVLRMYPNIPWSAPEYLGGPGLIPDGDKMDERDIKACSILICHINDPKSKMQVRRCKVEPDWKVYENSEEKIRAIKDDHEYFYELRPKTCTNTTQEFEKLNVDSLFQKSYQNYEQLTNSLTVEQLFTAKGLNELFEMDVHNSKQVRELAKSNRSIMKRNMASWKKAYELSFKHMDFCRTQDEIMQEKKLLKTSSIRV